MQIVSGNEHVTFSYDQARAAISEIEAAISQEQLKSEDKDAALEMLTEIRDKITQEKKPGVIKALLVGLKDFLINIIEKGNKPFNKDPRYFGEH